MAWKLDLLRRLNDQSVPYAIIGGVAAIAHGSARMTEDLDVCVPLNDELSVRIIRAYHDLSPRWRMRPDLPVIQEDSSNLIGLKNMYLRTSLGQVDLLGELPGVGNFDSLKGRTVEMMIGAIPVRVIDIHTLIQAKQAAGREKDKQDLRELLLIRQKLQESGLL